MFTNKSVALLLAAPALAAAGQDDYYAGNMQPGRNVPPTEGCTVTGKVYSPVSKLDSDFTIQHGWDWCQGLCATSTIAQDDGTFEQCAHFAYYPDGKCYLQDSKATLIEAPTCNATNPCEHGFQVVSGPASCKTKESWVFPEMWSASDIFGGGEGKETETTTAVGPTYVGDGEECNGSLPPMYATLCKDDLVCHIPHPMPGAPGTCMTKEAADALDATTSGLPTAVFQAPEPPAEITLPPTETTTQEPAPSGATVVGYRYEPVAMEGSARLHFLSWKGCHQACVDSPYCEHFAYYPDGGCFIQGNAVTLKKAVCEDGSADCTELRVLTGPKDLEDKSTWPDLSAVDVPPPPTTTTTPPTTTLPVLPTTGAAAPVPTVPPLPTAAPMEVPTPVVPATEAPTSGPMSGVSSPIPIPGPSSKEIEISDAPAKEEGGSGLSTGAIVGIVIACVAILFLCMAGFWAYTTGALDSLFCEGSDSDEEEGAAQDPMLP